MNWIKIFPIWRGNCFLKLFLAAKIAILLMNGACYFSLIPTYFSATISLSLGDHIINLNNFSNWMPPLSVPRSRTWRWAPSTASSLSPGTTGAPHSPPPSSSWTPRGTPGRGRPWRGPPRPRTSWRWRHTPPPGSSSPGTPPPSHTLRTSSSIGELS